MFLQTTPVWIMLTPFALIWALAYFCAKFYSNTNDFKKSMKLYAPAAAAVVIVFWILGLPIVLGGFMAFAGFVLMMFFSNRFFYK